MSHRGQKSINETFFGVIGLPGTSNIINKVKVLQNSSSINSEEIKKTQAINAASDAQRAILNNFRTGTQNIQAPTPTVNDNRTGTQNIQAPTTESGSYGGGIGGGSYGGTTTVEATEEQKAIAETNGNLVVDLPNKNAKRNRNIKIILTLAIVAGAIYYWNQNNK